jgi:antitoxin component of RelBE/YafQ-DinJ toxin-antitoxin module
MMQLTIRASDDLMSKIEKIAKEMGLKKSDVTRIALAKFADEYTLKIGEQKPFDRVKHLIGVTESGVKDLGQRHREHLVNRIKRESK